MSLAKTAAERKADERQRHKEAGRVAVTVYIYPADREKLARYIKRLNQRAIPTVPMNAGIPAGTDTGDASSYARDA